jgi:hypothetical protein
MLAAASRQRLASNDVATTARTRSDTRGAAGRGPKASCRQLPLGSMERVMIGLHCPVRSGRANPGGPPVLANDRHQDARIPDRPTSRSRPTAIPHAAHSGHGVTPSPLSLAGRGSSLGQRRHRRQVDGACRTDGPDPASWRWRHDMTGILGAVGARDSTAKAAPEIGVGRCQAAAEACPVLDGPVRRDRRHLGVARADHASSLRPSSPSEPSLPNEGCPHVSPSSLRPGRTGTAAHTMAAGSSAPV